MNKWDLNPTSRFFPTIQASLLPIPIHEKNFKYDLMKSNHLILQMKKLSPRKLKSKCSMQCDWILCVLLMKECNDLSKRCVKSQVVENKISDSFENWNLFNHGSFFFFFEAHIILSHYAVLEAFSCSKKEYDHSLTI